MKTTTLEKLGNRLPMLLEDGTRPTFSFRPWRFKEEMKIGELKKKHKHFGRFVREVFSFMIESFNEKEWSSFPDSEKKILLNQLPLGSVMYMYFVLRMEALGEDIKMAGMGCPHCGESIDEFTADLNGLDVNAQENEDDRQTVYQLRKPFTLGEIKITGIKFKFTPWDAMEKLDLKNASNEAAIKHSMIRESLIGAISEEAGEVELDQVKLLENLTKKDIEGAYEYLDEHNGGPVMGLEMTCPSCSKEWNAPIQWDYSYFFSNSSTVGTA